MKKLASLVAGISLLATACAIPKPEHFEDITPMRKIPRVADVMSIREYLGDTSYWDKDGDKEWDYATYSIKCNYDNETERFMVEIYYKKMDQLFMYNTDGSLNRVLNREQMNKLGLSAPLMHMDECPSREDEK